MNFLPMKINQKATLLNFFCLQGLTLPRVLAYRYSAPYKTGAGFDSLIVLAGSRYFPICGFFMPVIPPYPVLWRDVMGSACARWFPKRQSVNPLRLATMFDSVLARLHKTVLEAANMATSPQSQLVILPYVSAVDPESSQLNQWLQETEIRLLDRVKEALDEAGVAWIDTRTRVRSQPAAADSDNVEGSDNA